MAIVVNGIPNAIPYAPTLVAPVNGSALDLTTPPTFEWAFTAGTLGQSMSAFAFRRKLINATTYQYWNASLGVWSGAGAVYTAGISNPGSITCDAAGNIYVVNSRANAVTKITPAGVVSQIMGGLSFPSAIAIDASGNLYVTNTGSSTVTKFAAGTYASSTFATGVAGIGAIVIDSSGNVFTPTSASTIVKITPAGTMTTFATLSWQVNSLAIDASNNIYAGSNGLAGVLYASKITPTGTVTTLGSVAGNFVTIAVDSSANVFLGAGSYGGSVSGTVSKISGGTLTTIATYSSGMVVGLAVSSTGNVFAAISGSSSSIVSQISTSGVVSTFDSGFVSIGPVCFDLAGNLFIGDIAANTVTQVPATAAVTWNPASDATLSGGIYSYTFPSGAWADTATGVATYDWSVATQDVAGSGTFAPDDTFAAELTPSLGVSINSTATAQPIISWSPTLTPGTTPASYRVLIYSAAQMAVSGFTIGTSPASYDSGVVGSSTALSDAVSGVYLTTGTIYTAYVQIVLSSGLSSAWTSYAWTTTYTAPATPTITAMNTVSAQGANTTTLTFEGLDSGSLLGHTYATVYSSDDGGTTWWTIRNGSQVALPNTAAPQTLTLTDNEQRPGYTRLYMAIVTATVGGLVVASATTIISNTSPTILRWWIRDPQNPAADMAVSLKPGTFKTISTERQQTVAILGRPDPVVLTDSFGLPILTFEIVFLADADYQAFENLRSAQHTLLFQGPAPVGHWYIYLGDTKNDELNLPSLRGWASNGDVIRNVTISAQAVAAP